MSSAVKKDPPASKDMETGPTSLVGQHPLLGLRQEVDSLFDNFFSSFSLGPFGSYASEFDPFRKLGTKLTSARGYMPSMDIKETDKEFKVSAELPGMDEADIELSLSDGRLVIKGEKKEEKKSEEEDHHLMERHYGSIYRSLPLPEGIIEDSIEAVYDKGILEITVKKSDTKEKVAKTVKIKTR
jgi:HSP20 family protein